MLFRVSICALAACAAGLGQPSFDKAPADVDDALKSRVAEFYSHHVDGKFRLAEAFVAEESKDDFYAGTKRRLEGVKIQEIRYSDDYRRAKVTLIAKMEILFPGMTAPEVHDVPMPSYWKVEGGGGAGI